MTRRQRRAAFLGSARLGNPSASVRLHIGELILHGARGSDRYRVGDVLRTELERTLASDVLPRQWTRAVGKEALDAGQIGATVNAHPRTLGTAVARAVDGALRR